MAFNIIRGKDKSNLLGKTRYEQQKNLVKEGWSAGLSGEQMERLKFEEKRLKEKHGKSPHFIRQDYIPDAKPLVDTSIIDRKELKQKREMQEIAKAREKDIQRFKKRTITY